MNRFLLFLFVFSGFVFCTETDASPEYPGGERLYPLVTGISCWIGDEDSIWLGNGLVNIRMRFRDEELREAFLEQPYQVGGTPSALNNKNQYHAAPCMYVVGTLTPPDETEVRREGKEARPVLHIKNWVTVVPYLCNESEAIVDWMPLKVDIKEHIISGHLPQSVYEKHEYQIAEYSPEELSDYRMHKGLYPVIGMDVDKKNATIVLAQTLSDTFLCPVEFKEEEQTEVFFTIAHSAEIAQACQEGAPPILYLIGRYDQEQKIFIAEKWTKWTGIVSDIDQLEKNHDSTTNFIRVINSTSTP